MQKFGFGGEITRASNLNAGWKLPPIGEKSFKLSAGKKNDSMVLLSLMDEWQVNHQNQLRLKPIQKKQMQF